MNSDASTAVRPEPPATLTKPARIAPAPRNRVRSAAATLQAQGEPLVWLSGGSLAVALVMVVGLLSIIFYHGVATFWPQPVVELKLKNGKTFAGEVADAEYYRPGPEALEALPADIKVDIVKQVEQSGGQAHRRNLRTGNFELTGNNSNWLDDFLVVGETTPEWIGVFERIARGTAKGRFYGTPSALLIDGQEEATTPVEAWKKFATLQDSIEDRRDQAKALAKHEIGAVSRRQQDAAIAVVQARMSHGLDSPQYRDASDRQQDIEKSAKVDKERIEAEIAKLVQENERYKLRVQTAQGQTVELPLATIVRAYPANQLSLGEKLGLYFSRWGEFLFDEPREANTEGGVWPAIWGTIAMTVILSLLVVPFGVLAALYLREYAKAGPVVSAIRIAINNLAGVPSIVFGVFGLGFFCYGMGKFVDIGVENPADRWSPGSWWSVMGLLIGLSVAATCCVYFGMKRGAAGESRAARMYSRAALVLWLSAFVTVILLIIYAPFFEGFYRAKKEVTGSPTFGTGGLLWASLTLALLTLPVVIVATEEALAAVPNSMREGSYACGASKWQTIWRIVLPRAMPGIMTGMILAMARGAGEVAPLILVGVKDTAQELPMDGVFPFIHLDRGFLHLSYQINMAGLKSPDAEAAKPMVFTMILLLITVIALLNVAAVWLRGRLRRKYLSTQF